MERESFTKERIEGFLKDMAGRGRSASCLQSYRRSLTMLYEALPQFRPEAGPADAPERFLDRETGSAWVDWMKQRGTPVRTVNARISAWNSFTRYIGRKEWRLEIFSDIEDGVKPELSRSEYLRLLSAAKRKRRDKAYMLVMAIGVTGLRVQELPLLTVEAVLAGRVNLAERGMSLRLPQPLQRELKGYIMRQGITSGPVFVTGEGSALPRSGVNSCIRQLCADAHVSSEKATPSCLRNMYEETRKNIQASILQLAEQAYEEMLEQEGMTAGWEA